MWWVVINPKEACELAAEVLDETTGELFMSAVILLTGFCVYSRNPNKIAAWLGYNRSFVRQVCRRYRENGMWPSPSVSHAEWELGDGIFVIDCMVGIGQVTRTINEEGISSYTLTEKGHRA